jgi:hypothetical protein
MSLLLVLLLLVKAYGVARFSLTTSVTLVTAAPLSVLIGTLELYAYAFTAALAAAALWLFIMGMLANGELRRWTPLTFTLFLFATLLAPPLYLYWTFGAVILSLILYQIFVKTRHVRSLYMRLTRSADMPSPSRIAACVAALLAAGFLLFTIDRPWLPAEVVALKHPIIVRTSAAPLTWSPSRRRACGLVSPRPDRVLTTSKQTPSTPGQGQAPDSYGAQISQIWILGLLTGTEPAPVQIGGSSRCSVSEVCDALRSTPGSDRSVRPDGRRLGLDRPGLGPLVCALLIASGFGQDAWLL